MNEAFAREEICRIGKSLFDRGYVHSTAGNISVKLDDGFLITPTDACLGFLDPQQLSKVNANGEQVSGARASKTLLLHRRIYAANETAGFAPRCIIHTHSTYSVALSLSQSAEYLWPAVTPYAVMKVGRVPLVPYHRPGDPTVGDIVEALIAKHAAAGNPIRAVMLARLGPNVWHDTPAQAMAALEELEETSKLCCVMSARGAGELSEAQVAELKEAFGSHW